MRAFHTALIGSAVLAALAPQGIAHFRLIEPASWIQEAPNGDPQKMGPCGGTSADPGKPSAAVTNVQGGDSIPANASRSRGRLIPAHLPLRQGAGNGC